MRQSPLRSSAGADSTRLVMWSSVRPPWRSCTSASVEYVTLTYGTPADAPLYVPPTKLLIVGTATFPAIGFASTISDHTSMGTGALFSNQALPTAFDNAVYSSSDPALDGPNLALVRIRPGAPPAATLASLQRIARAADTVFADQPGGAAGNAIVVQGVQRPAEIVNYRTIGATPTLLVSALALGVIVALALTLMASVRQRRRDLALLKAVGFVRWQLAAAVAWQATVAAVVGIIVGIPLGIIAGRWLWDLFVRQIYAGSLSDRVGPLDRPCGDRHPCAGQRRRRRSGPDGGADTHSHDAAGGMNGSGLRGVEAAQSVGFGAGLRSSDDLA